jgi:polyhydroxybutyrate depolymerase
VVGIAGVVTACSASTDTLKCTLASPATAAGGVEERILADGVTRTFIAHVPRDSASGRLPLVIAFPGRGESAEQMENYSDLDSLDAVVLYAQGLPGAGGESSWEGTPFVPKTRNDLAFVSALIGWASRSACVDVHRITLAGKSDGGGFADLAACDPDIPVAVLLADSAAFYDQRPRCEPRHPVTVLNLAGTADSVIPIDGDSARGLRSERAVSDEWAHLDECAARENTVTGAFIRVVWTECADGTSVTQYRLDGDGHTWAGATTDSGPGATSRAVSATGLLRSVLEGGLTK